MKFFLPFMFALFFAFETYSQPVEVQYDYDAIGDCIFSATNNTKAPLYIHINFADLQNTAFTETLPYVKRLTPGFNALFTLQRDVDAGVPTFNYEVKSFRSDPMADVNLDFPYLIPFKTGKKVRSYDVENIEGFWGSKGVKDWSATGFYCKPGEQVFASRNGVVVEVVGAQRSGDSQNWYHTWNNSITLLQPDGTLACYRNVIDKTKKLKVGTTVYAGQALGEIVSGASKMKLLIFHNSLNTKGLLFIIPQFVIDENTNALVNSATEYSVVHPNSVRGLEMSKREKKKILGKK